MRTSCLFWLSLLFSLGVVLDPLCLISASARGQEPLRGPKVEMDFNGVELTIFLQWFSNVTGKRIIYGDLKQSQKKIYITSPEPVPEKEVEKIVYSLLESNGFTLLKVGQGENLVYKLIESERAAQKSQELYSKEQPLEDGDYYVSQVVQVKHLKVEKVVSALRSAKLMDERVGSIVEIKGANCLIISDFLPAVKRLVKIIELLDKEPPKIVSAYVTLRHAKAEEISQRINQVFQNKAKEMADYNLPNLSLTVIADSRLNSLTLRGTKEELKYTKELIVRWDEEVKESEVVAKIYNLSNVTPDKILPTLRELISTPMFREKSLTSERSPQGPQIAVIANEYAKSLVITAPKATHKLLEDIIKQLDIRRPQVLLEAVIVEFSPSDSLTLGFELMQLDTEEDEGALGHVFSSFGLTSLVDKAGNPIKETGVPSGRSIGVGRGITTFMTKDRATNIPFLLKAIQSVTYAEVLSTPRILTDDGERAEIRVEQEEPVVSINVLNQSTTTQSFKEFVPAGTRLAIKPQIIHKDWLRLEIEQEIEAFVGNPPAAGIPPPKSSRNLKTTVTVPDGHMVILGGLCQRREVETVDKIPLLGDIPILGFIFQSRTRTITKTNLYIFIKPTILSHPKFNDLKEVSKQTQDEIEQVKKALKGDESTKPKEENGKEKPLDPNSSTGRPTK